MVKIIRNLLLIIFLAITTITQLWAQESQVREDAAVKIMIDNCRLDNMYKIDNGVYRSEQPSRSDFKALEHFGIKEVLSLRNWNDDKDEARDTSIITHSLKTRASKIDQDDLIEALRIIKNRTGPIVVHCWHGSDRTGAVVAAYRVVFQGWSKEDAIDEMTNGGFGFHKQFMQIKDVINSLDIEYVKRQLGM